MRVSIQVLVAIILVIIVIVALFGATSVVTSSAGENISNTGEHLGDKLNCIFRNKENPSQNCKTSDQLEKDGPVKI
ncbi:MAG: hypothetical protein ABEJ75_04210 [Candidatus Nanohaloarchaea archaeon]